jgi:hypothetical protein
MHDRDTKFCASFRDTLESGGIKPLALPPRSPNLNAFAERWVRSVKQECLSKLILFGEDSLRRALTEFVEHFHRERNHRGKRNSHSYRDRRKCCNFRIAPSECGVPHFGFSGAMRRMRARSSPLTFSRPARRWDRQRQYSRKPRDATQRPCLASQ